MKSAPAPRLTFRTASTVLLFAAAGLGGLSALAGGCSVDQPSALVGTSSTSTSGGGGGGGDAGLTNGGEALFREIEDALVESCATCHDAGGIANTPFLAGPDRYLSMLSWPGVITKDPGQSVLVTHPIAGGNHLGTNIDSAALKDTVLPLVEAWLAEESNGIAEPASDAGPRIEPFTPILGFNAVYLDALGEDLGGMAITFNAEEIGNASLLLNDVEVHPTAKLGVHMVHPLFVVFPKGQSADPDPVDSFSNLDQYFEPGESAPLGPGTLVLTNWQSKAKLSVAFETIVTYSDEVPDAGDDGGGLTGGCKDVTSFSDNAAGPLGACTGCHGGNNGQATNAVDMSALGSDAAAACAQVRNRVSPANPDASQLFITTNPDGNAAHPFKFNGDDQAFADFKNALSVWISAEL